MLHFHEREIRKYRGDYSKPEHIIDFVTNRFLTTPVDSSLSSALKYPYLHIIIYIIVHIIKCIYYIILYLWLIIWNILNNMDFHSIKYCILLYNYRTTMIITFVSVVLVSCILLVVCCVLLFVPKAQPPMIHEHDD